MPTTEVWCFRRLFILEESEASMNLGNRYLISDKSTNSILIPYTLCCRKIRKLSLMHREKCCGRSIGYQINGKMIVCWNFNSNRADTPATQKVSLVSLPDRFFDQLGTERMPTFKWRKMPVVVHNSNGSWIFSPLLELVKIILVTIKCEWILRKQCLPENKSRTTQISLFPPLPQRHKCHSSFSLHINQSALTIKSSTNTDHT